MAKFMIRTVLCVAALSACLLFAAGCDDGKKPEAAPKAAQGKPVVGVFLYRDDDVYISLVSRALQAGLAGKGEIALHAAGSDQLTQNDQIDAVLARKADALVVNLVDTQAASFVLDKAKKAGIPVLFFNREPDLASIKTYDKTCFVGTVATDAGKMQGDIIKRLWDAHPEYDRNKDGQFQYIMIQANADNPEAVARTEFSVRQARELGVPIRQIGETLMCEWDEPLAYEAMRLALATLADSMELVIANNDSMALGAVAALQEAGYNKEGGEPGKYIPVIGVDATPQAVEAIGKGVMSATVKQDGELMGNVIATFILNAVNGKSFIDNTPWKWDESGIGVRLPYSPFGGDR